MDVDPDTLLEWLQTGHEDVRDMQLIALEQLCQILLLSDNIDRCFESYPPRTFLPALCKIFLDESAPDNVLEATARSLTYYLDVSQECTRRIVSVEGTIKAICNRLLVIEVDNKISKDLAEQCIKTLELICARESSAVYEAGGLTCILPFILDYGKLIFKDSLYSAISVIARLCGKIELSDVQTLESCIESLSKLLRIYSQDTFIIDHLLRCFASLTDRFIRKSIDPVQLAKYDLVNILIQMLNENIQQQQHQHQLQQQHGQPQQQQPHDTSFSSVAPTTSTNNTNTVSISTITGLLTTLCRNSMQITNEIFKQNILDSIEKAILHGDERCVLDTIRFLDILLILLFEGRDILPKAAVLPVQPQIVSTGEASGQVTSTASTKPKRMDSTLDKYHRQLIELIRNKETEAFVDLLETNQIDINYMDDVGQTLLNWSSAFGTAEMVEYLCKKQADVNRGQRSSSLHYAACFGRANIVQVLLSHGANPDLRDEDGKTALDKARERTDDGHREVVQILQTSNEFLVKNSNRKFDMCASDDDDEDDEDDDGDEDNKESHNDDVDGAKPKTVAHQSKSEKFCLNKQIANCEEIADTFIRHLIPMFCNFYMNCMLQNINKCTLNILRKLIYYSNKAQIEAILCKKNNLIIELVSKLLQETFNYELILNGVNISLDLIIKCQQIILNEFNRYGVSNRIIELIAEFSSSATSTCKNLLNYEESETIDLDRVYIWNLTWFIVYTKDFIYIWNGHFIIELSHNSNGWFRFMINSNLYSMYSNGQPELCSNMQSNTCQTFIDKFNKSKEAILGDLNDSNASDKFRCIFKSKLSHQIQVENWQFNLSVAAPPSVVVDTTVATTAQRSGDCIESQKVKQTVDCNELCITNMYANQKTILNTNFKNGFQFESNRQEKLKFVSESKLTFIEDLIPNEDDRSVAQQAIKDDETSTSPAVSAKTKDDNLIKKQIYDLAFKINKNYIAKNNEQNKNTVTTKLNRIIQKLQTDSGHDQDEATAREATLHEFKQFLIENNDYISSYELSISGIVHALMSILTDAGEDQVNKAAATFMHVFNNSSDLKILIHKLVLLLESIERLPVYLYDAPYTYNLQVFSKRFKLILNTDSNGQEAADNGSNKNLLNFNGRVLKVEPLANVSHLEKYLSKMVAKHWFDYARADLFYLNTIRETAERGECLEFKYESDFDRNGLIYWIGTNARRYECWVNPCTYNLVEINSIDGKQLPCGHLSDILSHELVASVYTSDCQTAWFAIDLGVYIQPTHYSLRLSKGYNSSTSAFAPRNWSLQMSRNGQDWSVLCEHINDERLSDAGSTATWQVKRPQTDETTSGGDAGWRFVRLQQNGKNSSGQHAHFCIAGFEIYGRVTEAPVFTRLETIQIKIAEPVSVAETTTTTTTDENTSSSTASIQQQQRKPAVHSHKQRLSQTAKFNLQRQMVSGVRVQRGTDWKWSNQDGGCDCEGTIIGDINSNGWIECIWDNGTFNYYRMGAENKYDLRVTTSASYDQAKIGEYNEAALKKLTVTMLNLNLNKKQIQFNNSVNSSGNPSGNPNGKKQTTLTRLFSEQIKKNNKNLNRILSEIDNKTAEQVLDVKFNKKFSSTPTLNTTTKAQKQLGGGSGGSGSGDKTQHTSHTQIQQQQQIHESDSALLTSQTAAELTNKLESQQQQLKHHTLSLDNDLNDARQAIRQLETTMEEDTVQQQHQQQSEEHDEDEEDDDYNTQTNDEEDDEDMLNNDDADEFSTASSSVDTGTTAVSTDVSSSSANKINKLLTTCLNNLNVDDFNLKSLLYQINLWNMVNNKDTTNIDLDALVQPHQQQQQRESESKASVGGGDKRKDSATEQTSSNLLHELDDDDLAHEDDAICENDNDANTTTDDADDYMDDEMLNEYEKLQQQLSQHQQQHHQLQTQQSSSSTSSVTHRTNLTNEHLLRMRDLKRRHTQQQQQPQSQQQQQLHQDEFVLKCQFSALIPAFDPRPGKVNVNQIQDIQIPQSQAPSPPAPAPLPQVVNEPKQQSPTVLFTSTIPYIPKIDLYLRVSKQCVMPDGSHIEYNQDEIKLTNKNATIFQYIQQLITTGKDSAKNFSIATLKYEKMKLIWDTSYTLIYREAKQASVDTANSEPESVVHGPFNDILATQKNVKCSVHDVLKVLSMLKNLVDDYSHTSLAEEFYSKKLNNKLIQQLQDSLVLASRSLPDWCMHLLHSYKFLFPFETRQLYFQTTAFGVSRSIVWLQAKREQLLANIRGPSSQRRTNTDEHMHTNEFRIGRLKHERVKIPREPYTVMLQHAMNTLKYHATRKAILEFEFLDEEGTGLGPTLEFYSLVAMELQRKVYALWYCDSDDVNANEFYHTKCGLFPAPFDYKQLDVRKGENILELFYFMGIFIAKSLQDQRLVDMPLSLPFLKILCFYKEAAAVVLEAATGSSETTSEQFSFEDLKKPDCKLNSNLDVILCLDDLELIDVHRGQLLKKLKDLINDKQCVNAALLTADERSAQISSLKLDFNGTQCSVDDLTLVFQYSPPSSKLYGYEALDLLENGANIHVTMDNIELYYELMVKFLLKYGIEKQIKAFKIGFDSVFPMDSLKSFTPYELQILLSGEQAPKWTRDDIMNYTEPKLGYTRESPGFQRFVNVMCSMDADERKSFVQFLTGCSSLPPGGLANLHPRLTIVKKDGCDSNYPSVNTCVHYLKLPEYSSEDILKQRLTIACKEKGFYLN